MSTGTWGQRRVTALLELLEAGAATIAEGTEIDNERAMVLVVADYDIIFEQAGTPAELAGGIPVSGETARRLACDAGLVRIITRGASEILDVGRKTREWTEAQRRAIRYLHHGTCAFPGCELRITQIHHCNPWKPGGETNLDVGVPLCHIHHHLVHEGGWKVSYQPATRTTTFTGPQKQIITATDPGRLPLVA